MLLTFDASRHHTLRVISGGREQQLGACDVLCPQELDAVRLRSVSAADMAALKSRTELLNGQKASLLSEMNAMVRPSS